MEIIGIGTDIVDVQRFENVDENFLKKYFTENEIEYFEKRKNNIQVIAGNFSSKEAIVKALGTGFKNIMPIDIEVLRDDNGKPIAKVNTTEHQNLNFMITISHTNQTAVAFAIAYI